MDDAIRRGRGRPRKNDCFVDRDIHKNCPKCGLTKSSEDFHFCFGSKDKMQSICKKCANKKRPKSKPKPAPTHALVDIKPSVEQVKHFNQKQLAERWCLSIKTLERWRWQKTEIPFIKIGGHVVYRLKDIEDYENKNTQAII